MLDGGAGRPANEAVAVSEIGPGLGHGLRVGLAMERFEPVPQLRTFALTAGAGCAGAVDSLPT